ncbi:MAG: hypothetical protein QME81_04180 [bacterium]|nr:hypothetical protein [bacterium]
MREATIFQDWFLEAEEKGMERGMEKGMERGIERGMERGMEKGVIETLKEGIRDVLEERFGIVKESILNAVYQIKSAPFLRTLLRQSARVKSLEEFRELIAQR